MSIFLKINKPIENITETFTIIYTHIICNVYCLYTIHNTSLAAVFCLLEFT